jgi:hypothetical protein
MATRSNMKQALLDGKSEDENPITSFPATVTELDTSVEANIDETDVQTIRAQLVEISQVMSHQGLITEESQDTAHRGGQSEKAVYAKPPEPLPTHKYLTDTDGNYEAARLYTKRYAIRERQDENSLMFLDDETCDANDSGPVSPPSSTRELDVDIISIQQPLREQYDESFPKSIQPSDDSDDNRKSLRDVIFHEKPNDVNHEGRRKEFGLRKDHEQQAERSELEEYNASPIRGFPARGSSTDHYNPLSAPLPIPRATRPPNLSNGHQPRLAIRQSSPATPQPNIGQNGRSREHTEGPHYRNSPNNAPQPSQTHSNSQPQIQPKTLAQPHVTQVKLPNVSKDLPNTPTDSDNIQQNDAEVLTANAQFDRQKNDRMSESEILARLKDVVSKGDPCTSYWTQKIGRRASGLVYVARIKMNPPSPIARQVLREQGSIAQVAIKQIDLTNQPRKELIFNEIMVMKDSKHQNIVNFLEAFLHNNFTELWVIMEYMDGGDLFDVIQNNPVIAEDQISTICLEVRLIF